MLGIQITRQRMVLCHQFQGFSILSRCLRILACFSPNNFFYQMYSSIKLSYPGAPPSNVPGNQFPNFNSTMDKMTSQMNTMSVTNTGFDKIWVSVIYFSSLSDIFIYFFFVSYKGHDNVDLLQVRNILPAQGVETPRIRLKQEHLNNVHCSLDIFRCTLTKIPETNSILQKSRLPLGVLIHPFKDLTVIICVQQLVESMIISFIFSATTSYSVSNYCSLSVLSDLHQSLRLFCRSATMEMQFMLPSK